MPMKRTEATDLLVRLCNPVLLKGERAEMPNLSPKEWNCVLTLAAEHGVLPVIAPMLTDLKFEDEASRMTMVQWYAVAQQNKQQYAMHLDTMQYLAKIFGQDGLDIMFMKGATLSQLYPEPTWRVFGDIDYYLFGKSERGNEVLKNHSIESSAYYHHHTQASLNDILIENHYDFVERVNHKCDIILDDALKALAKKEGRTMKASFLGEDVNNAYVMTPTMNAIFLMRHMSAHFVSETIPLRMFYDWALFLKRHAKDVDWTLVTGLYDKSVKTTFAGIVQELLRKRLDICFADCPVSPVKEEYVDKVWESVIFPPEANPYKKKSLKYYLYETKVFMNNRWKHEIVYPGESYALLFFKYVMAVTKKKLGLLK